MNKISAAVAIEVNSGILFKEFLNLLCNRLETNIQIVKVNERSSNLPWEIFNWNISHPETIIPEL